MDNRKIRNLDHFTYYDLLCVNALATPDEIKKAYHHQAWLWHPDQAKNHIKVEDLIYAESIFKLISEANETLSNPGQRIQYDRSSPDNPSCFERNPSLFNIWLKYNYESYVDLQASKIQALQAKIRQLEVGARTQDTQPKPSYPSYPTSFYNHQPQAANASRFYEQPSKRDAQNVINKIKAHGLLRIDQVSEEPGSKTYDYLHLHFASSAEAERFHTGHWKFLVNLEKEDAMLHVQSFNILKLPEVLKVTIALGSDKKGKGEIILSKFGKYVEINDIPKSRVFCDPNSASVSNHCRR